MFVYLPFESWIVGFLPGSASSVARYGVEALGWCCCRRTVLDSDRGAIVGVITWVRWPRCCGVGLAAVLAGISTYHRGVGYRRNFGGCSWLSSSLDPRPRLDTRWYGRAVVAPRRSRACIAVAEWLGGVIGVGVLRAELSIVIGGLSVSSSASAHVHSISARSTITTLWPRTSCSRGRCSSRSGGGARASVGNRPADAGALDPVCDRGTGSREAALALVVAAGILARIRFRLPTLRVALLLGRSRRRVRVGVHHHHDPRQGHARTTRERGGR